MPERLTPEQLNRFADELEVAYPDRAVIRGLRQAARDARTLDRVRAWTARDSDDEICDAVCLSDIGNSACHREQVANDQREVAALLRAEEPPRA